MFNLRVPAMRRIFNPLAAALMVCAALAAPAPAAETEKIEAAIRRGAEFLKKGNPNPAGDLGYGSGPAALAGLALLEAGTPATDPAVAAIAQAIRAAAVRETRTYQAALDILFLDRLGDPADRPLIQVLGCRLMAGQNAAGGWTYTAYDQVTPAEEAMLVGPPRGGAAPKADPKKGKPKAGDPGFGIEPKAGTPAERSKLHPAADVILQAVRRGARSSAAGGGDDNSNTQFGIMGLWVARRHGVPCDSALRLIEARFVRTQSPIDHGWGYNAGPGSGSGPSMTCAGLLGLAVGKGAAEAKPAPKPKATDDDPFFRPPAPGEGDGDKPAADPKALTGRDQAIKRGLTAVGRLLGAAGRGAAPVGAAVGYGGTEDYYFLWSVERVAVAFGLETIGDVDWYRWGTDRLLPAQQADGSWKGQYNQTVDTAFAVLFLSKSNFVADLTRQISGKVKDPGGGELRGTRGGPLAISPKGRAPDAPRPAAGGPAGPNLNPVAGVGEIEKAADTLAGTDDKAWSNMLKTTRDKKGGQYTAALVMAIPRLEGRRLYEARGALADRLTRMTPDTLRKMLTDRDPELRRAAALACAMRDDKTHVPDLIERVADLDDGVVRAARAGLKSLTDRDFGPPFGATEEQKRKAADEWRLWYATEGKGR